MSLDSPGARSEPGASEDLLVTSLSVQGGEAVIGDEKTAFARILMSGMRLQNMQLPVHRVKTRQVTLLKLDLAEELAEGLREIMNHWARSSPTPVLPARGTWSWHSQPLPSDDILVSEVKAGRGDPDLRSSDPDRPLGLHRGAARGVEHRRAPRPDARSHLHRATTCSVADQQPEEVHPGSATPNRAAISGLLDSDAGHDLAGGTAVFSASAVGKGHGSPARTLKGLQMTYDCVIGEIAGEERR